MLILGLDPGLGTTGWGLIAADGNRLSHVANGQIRTEVVDAARRAGWRCSTARSSR